MRSVRSVRSAHTLTAAAGGSLHSSTFNTRFRPCSVECQGSRGSWVNFKLPRADQGSVAVDNCRPQGVNRPEPDRCRHRDWRAGGCAGSGWRVSERLRKAVRLTNYSMKSREPAPEVAGGPHLRAAGAITHSGQERTPQGAGA